MDRHTVNIAKAQVGYIDFIIKPSYETLAEVLPNMIISVTNAESNKACYAKLVPKYESQMSSNNENLTRSIENAKQKSVETDDDGLLWILKIN